MESHTYTLTQEIDPLIGRLVAEGGSRVHRRIIGRSVRGRPIHAVTVAAPGREPSRHRTQALVIGGMHGIEVVSTELAFALLRSAVEANPSEGEGAGDVLAALDGADVTFVSSVNPDGRAASMASLVKPAVLFRWGMRGNARGVDLNRNWPAPAGDNDTAWHPLAGTDIPWLPWYRGSEPLSEPETQALDALVDELRPAVILNLHCNGQLLVYPWSAKREACPDVEAYEEITAAFAAAQPVWPYEAKQSSSWYPVTGSSNDYFYDRYGALSFTVEMAPFADGVKRRWARARRQFWWVNPEDPEIHVGNDAPGCWAAIRAGAAIGGATARPVADVADGPALTLVE